MDNLKQFAEAVGADIKKLIESIPEKIPKKATFTTGNEASGVYPIIHNFDTEDVVVSVYNTNRQQVITDVQVVDANSVNIIVRQGVNLTGYKVVIVG